MASYDSDSSDGGDNYTSTNVLLGYASSEPTDDSTSHLGGHPAWIDDKTAPSGALAKCRVCNGLLTLLLELNGTLPEHFPDHERRLYILSCRRKACRRKDGSVRGIRSVRVAKVPASDTSKESKKDEASAAPQEEKKSQPLLGESLFGVKPSAASSTPSNPFSTSSNPFSSGFSTSTSSNPFTSASALAAKPAQPPFSATLTTLPETFASKARISSHPPAPSQLARPHEPWPAQSAFPPPYPRYHLDAEYETLDAPSTPSIPANARVDMDLDAGESSSAGAKEEKEAFESTLDKTFQRFADRLAQNPDQVLRYEFRGIPLLYSRDDAVGKLLAPHQPDGNEKVKTVSGSKGGKGIPRCTSCGAERIFEMQLTPQAITELEAEEMGLEGMEWGTIIMAVCGKDCMPSDLKQGDVGYVEEWIGVQWEEVKKPGQQ